jgi:hypothetical protein
VRSLAIDGELSARFLGTGISKTLGAPTETWVVHPHDDPFEPVLQVELYRHGLTWEAWTGSLTRRADRELAQRVAAARSAVIESRVPPRSAIVSPSR